MLAGSRSLVSLSLLFGFLAIAIQSVSSQLLLDDIDFNCIDPEPAFDPTVFSYLLVVPASISKLSIDVYYSYDDISIGNPVIKNTAGSNVLEATLTNLATAQNECASYLNGSSQTQAQASLRTQFYRVTISVSTKI